MTREWWIASIVVILACAGDERSAASDVRAWRDSAGVLIFESSAAASFQLTVADTPAVRIGVVDGDEHYQLHRVSGVRVSMDGSILVLNASTHEVRRYDSDGKWQSSHGRRGSGPGEMQAPIAMVPSLADSSAILDFSMGIHIVGPQGRIARVLRTRTPLSGFVGMLDSVTAVIARPIDSRGAYDQIVTADVVVAVAGLRTSHVDTLLTVRGQSEYRYAAGDLLRSVAVPFTAVPWVGVRDGEIYVSDGRSPEVRIYRRDGQLMRILRLPFPADPISEEDWQSAVRIYLESAAGRRGEARLTARELERQRDIYDAMPRPEHKPYFDMMYLNDPDLLWVRRFELGKPQRWTGLDSEGRMVVEVLVPPRVLVREITEEWVLGQENDEMEVEYVVRYPTVRDSAIRTRR